MFTRINLLSSNHDLIAKPLHQFTTGLATNTRLHLPESCHQDLQLLSQQQQQANLHSHARLQLQNLLLTAIQRGSGTGKCNIIHLNHQLNEKVEGKGGSEGARERGWEEQQSCRLQHLLPPHHHFQPHRSQPTVPKNTQHESK